MDKLQRETCQVENSVILENLIVMSRDHGIPVTVKTRQGDVYTGKLMADVPCYVATVGTIALYIRCVIEGSEEHESHAVIPVSSIDSMTFCTKKGFLDNLVEPGRA